MQNDFMTSITIRHIPEDTHAELAARAARRGQSLQEYLRSQLLELVRRPDARTLMGRVDDRKKTAGTRLPADRIIEHRDRGRR